VVVVTIAAATGAIETRISTTRSDSPVDTASCALTILTIPNRPCRSVLLIVAASSPSESNAAIVINAAKPDVQSTIRPTGYHSRLGLTGNKPLFEETPALTGRPNNTRWPSHQ